MKPKFLIRKRKISEMGLHMESLSSLLAFSNADIEAMNEAELIELAVKVVAQSTGRSEEMKLIEEWDRVSRLTRDFPEQSEPDVPSERKPLIFQIQQHARSKLNAIIEAWKDGKSTDQLFNLEGTLRVDVNSHEFQEKVELDWKVDDPLEVEKRFIDLWLISLIRSLLLEPTRINVCKRCGKYFYRASLKEREYCSGRCSNAYRQAEFQKKEAERKKAQEIMSLQAAADVAEKPA